MDAGEGNEGADEKVANEAVDEAGGDELDNDEYAAEGAKPSLPYVGTNSGVETELVSIRLSMRAGCDVAGMPDEGLYDDEGGTKPVFPDVERSALILATKSSTFSDAVAGGISVATDETLGGREPSPRTGAARGARGFFPKL